jgi:hypothetical protein
LKFHFNWAWTTFSAFNIRNLYSIQIYCNIRRIIFYLKDFYLFIPLCIIIWLWLIWSLFSATFF